MPNTRCAKRRRGVLDNRAEELRAEGLTPRDHRKYLTQVTQDLVKVVTHRLGRARARTMTGVREQQSVASIPSTGRRKTSAEEPKTKILGDWAHLGSSKERGYLLREDFEGYMV